MLRRIWPPGRGPAARAAALIIGRAAIDEATKNQWMVMVASVDAGGNLVLFERMDNTQILRP
jgi:uncharacterized protein GlcG (DUF336 family)